MMRNPYLITCFICLLLAGLSCKKGAVTTTGTFKGKIILMACGTAAIDIEGPTGTGGGSVWVASSTNTYNNAVNVANYCYLADQVAKTGYDITFDITKDNSSVMPNCIVPQCYIKGPGPNSSVYVSNVKKAGP
ncbi:MAG: hypothetical protein V4592_21425 [Bacteroidota bacterium]